MNPSWVLPLAHPLRSAAFWCGAFLTLTAFWLARKGVRETWNVYPHAVSVVPLTFILVLMAYFAFRTFTEVRMTEKNAAMQSRWFPQYIWATLSLIAAGYGPEIFHLLAQR
jgi:hypothetical protein